VTVTALTTQTAGLSLRLQCSVTTMSAITGGMVDIVWRRNGVEVTRTSVPLTNFISSSAEYTNTYDTRPLSENDDGVMYQCEVINSNPSASDTITLAVVGELQ